MTIAMTNMALSMSTRHNMQTLRKSNLVLTDLSQFIDFPQLIFYFKAWKRLAVLLRGCSVGQKVALPNNLANVQECDMTNRYIV